MGVQYDRILDAFDGPFTKVPDLLTPPPGQVVGQGQGRLAAAARDRQQLHPHQPTAEGEAARLLGQGQEQCRRGAVRARARCGCPIRPPRR